MLAQRISRLIKNFAYESGALCKQDIAACHVLHFKVDRQPMGVDQRTAYTGM
jgi:hypothetical protein